MSTLFISDLHLEDGRPDISGWMLEFLAGPARSAEVLYILGDLFEAWIGDDDDSALAERVAAALTVQPGSDAGVDIKSVAAPSTEEEH